MFLRAKGIEEIRSQNDFHLMKYLTSFGVLLSWGWKALLEIPLIIKRVRKRQWLIRAQVC